MKKISAILLIMSICVAVVGCGKEKPQGKKKINDTTTGISMTNISTTNPDPTPMKQQNKKLKSIYGKKTGTEKTYTGLEPLKEIKLPVIDPDNIRNLSEVAIKHSFGVSKNEIPHEISVNNQKLYEKYGAMCLDTTGERVVYLTFDCGYENGYTEKILDTLKEKNVKAAFFVTLPHIKSSPQIIARMINEGHIVGNHSVNHPDFSKISRTRMIKEIEELDNHLRTQFGYSSPFFRFPEGTCSESALDAVNNAGYMSVFWSSAYADWDVNNTKGKKYAVDTVTSRIHPGCVLMLHAVTPDNAEALGEIIDYAQNKNYTFKLLGE